MLLFLVFYIGFSVHGKSQEELDYEFLNLLDAVGEGNAGTDSLISFLELSSRSQQIPADLSQVFDFAIAQKNKSVQEKKNDSKNPATPDEQLKKTDSTSSQSEKLDFSFHEQRATVKEGDLLFYKPDPLKHPPPPKLPPPPPPPSFPDFGSPSQFPKFQSLTPMYDSKAFLNFWAQISGQSGSTSSSQANNLQNKQTNKQPSKPQSQDLSSQTTSFLEFNTEIARHRKTHNFRAYAEAIPHSGPSYTNELYRAYMEALEIPPPPSLRERFSGAAS